MRRLPYKKIVEHVNLPYKTVRSQFQHCTGGSRLVVTKENAVTCQKKMAASSKVALLRSGFELLCIKEHRGEEAKKNTIALGLGLIGLIGKETISIFH